MPKSAFFNLKTEKRNRILTSARNEFERNIFENVSIKRIIEEAGIPRGSFYQYFYNIEDLFEYEMDRLQNKIYQKNFEIDWVEGFDILEYLKIKLKRRMNMIFAEDLIESDFEFMRRIMESEEAKRFFVRTFGVFKMVDDELLGKIHSFCFPSMEFKEMVMVVETLFATIEKSLFKLMNKEKTILEMEKELDIKFGLIGKLVQYE